MHNSQSYNLILKYIEDHRNDGFHAIDWQDLQLIKLEEFLASNEQFFFIGDMIHMKILYTSKGSKTMLGIDPAELSPYHFLESTHPDDLHRHNLGRTKIFKMAQDIFIAQNGSSLLSTNLRFRNSNGIYINTLVQCFMFYSVKPYRTVYIIQVVTNIEWFRHLNHGYHYYVGEGLSNFRYPDKKLLRTGNVLSRREFEIVKLIAGGFKSSEIAEKMYLSLHTINTHRRNILKKTGNSNLSELITELKDKGIF